MSPNQPRTARDRQLHVGDAVTYDVGGYTFHAKIVEDRGHVGVGGRHLLRVEEQVDGSEPIVFEMPADELVQVG